MLSPLEALEPSTSCPVDETASTMGTELPELATANLRVLLGRNPTGRAPALAMPAEAPPVLFATTPSSSTRQPSDQMDRVPPQLAMRVTVCWSSVFARV